MIPKSNILNLHELCFEGEGFVQEELEEILDGFVSPFLLDKHTQKLLIITGKGIHSRHFINGKNPLRYYTEIYLDKIQVDWYHTDIEHGGVGAIVVDL
jgi:DNA-nicking Smr family endonuclease